ncbi:MAG: cytochrome c biogenesis CcdA family protein [Actinomycetota bacterium]|nr:cytochrome c biogenesis CcdA family protein [Actinomycetota bacterium]
MSIESLASQLTGGSLGIVAAFGIAFLGGMVAGFGPCVLPMLPAVFGYVTGQVAETPGISQRSAWRKGLALSATFVPGMSLLFAAIGAAAALLGRALLVGAWAYYVVAAICVVLGLQMMGAINLPFDALNRFVPNTRPERRGFLGAFLLGIVFGVVASPCSTPILAAIATIAATRGSVPEGALLLFVYGLGKGVPLILLGLASGSLVVMRSLSRATGVLTKIGGAALIGAAAYLVWLA